MSNLIRNRWIGRALTSLVVCLITANVSSGYSVLTHEALVDTVWKSSIQPLLLERFPTATPEELREARAYAYGGCIIQDMGYYPFGSRLFSDLAHYVRSGKFAATVIREAQDINEYAFGLGALAHYAADNSGHPLGTNRSVPILYPKLKKKYGDVVTYENDPTAHLKTEFGFDVLQVARGRYAPEAFHDFIGFKVSRPVLERAFKQTYGLEMKDIFMNVDLAIGTYRWSVSELIPEMTRQAWELKKDEITKEMPGMTRDKFRYRLPRRSFEKEWGKGYKKPGLSARALGFMLRVMPKVGPFKSLSFQPPTPETEKLLQTSFDVTVSRYREMLAGVERGRFDFEDQDLDTGRATRAGEYGLADKAYASLLHRLAGNKFANTTPELRDDILAFFGDGSGLQQEVKKDRDDWKRTMRELASLKALEIPPSTAKAR